MDTEYNKYNIQNYYQIHSITRKFLCNLPEELSILNRIEEPIFLTVKMHGLDGVKYNI